MDLSRGVQETLLRHPRSTCECGSLELQSHRTGLYCKLQFKLCWHSGPAFCFLLASRHLANNWSMRQGLQRQTNRHSV